MKRRPRRRWRNMTTDQGNRDRPQAASTRCRYSTLLACSHARSGWAKSKPKRCACPSTSLRANGGWYLYARATRHH